MSHVQRPIIWEGVYETLEEAQSEGAGFASEHWMERIIGQLLNYRKEIETHSLVMPARTSDLPFLVALTNANTIIDFGGSSGWTYDFLKKTVPQNTIYDYVIVEIEEIVCRMQAASLHTAPVSYLTDTSLLDGETGAAKGWEVNIFYTNSVLQYVYDDAVFLKFLEELQPNWLLIEDFLGGDFDNYFSLQKYYESRIPIRFRNRQDFLNGLHGYDLILAKPYAAEIMGMVKELPMDNFPIDKRVRYGETMLFQRKI